MRTPKSPLFRAAANAVLMTNPRHVEHSQARPVQAARSVQIESPTLRSMTSQNPSAGVRSFHATPPKNGFFDIFRAMVGANTAERISSGVVQTIEQVDMNIFAQIQRETVKKISHAVQNKIQANTALSDEQLGAPIDLAMQAIVLGSFLTLGKTLMGAAHPKNRQEFGVVSQQMVQLSKDYRDLYLKLSPLFEKDQEHVMSTLMELDRYVNVWQTLANTYGPVASQGKDASQKKKPKGADREETAQAGNDQNRVGPRR